MLLLLAHGCLRVPCVGLRSPNSSDRPADLSAIFVPLQLYLLSLGQVCSFLTDPDSIAACRILLEDIGNAALIPTCDLWTFVNYHRREHI